MSRTRHPLLWFCRMGSGDERRSSGRDDRVDWRRDPHLAVDQGGDVEARVAQTARTVAPATRAPGRGSRRSAQNQNQQRIVIQSPLDPTGAPWVTNHTSIRP